MRGTVAFFHLTLALPGLTLRIHKLAGINGAVKRGRKEPMHFLGLTLLLFVVANVFGQERGQKGEPGDAFPGPPGPPGEPGFKGRSGCFVGEGDFVERDRFERRLRPCQPGQDGEDQLVNPIDLIRLVFRREWRRLSDLELPPEWWDLERGEEIERPIYEDYPDFEVQA